MPPLAVGPRGAIPEHLPRQAMVGEAGEHRADAEPDGTAWRETDGTSTEPLRDRGWPVREGVQLDAGDVFAALVSPEGFGKSAIGDPLRTRGLPRTTLRSIRGSFPKKSGPRAAFLRRMASFLPDGGAGRMGPAIDSRRARPGCGSGPDPDRPGILGTTARRGLPTMQGPRIRFEQ
jgi:hypothetical protein